MKKIIFIVLTAVSLTLTSCEDVLREVIAAVIEYSYYESGCYDNGDRWNSYYFNSYGNDEFCDEMYCYGDKYFIPTTSGFYIQFINTRNGLETRVIESLPYGYERCDFRPSFYDNYRRVEFYMWGERLIFNLVRSSRY